MISMRLTTLNPPVEKTTGPVAGRCMQTGMKLVSPPPLSSIHHLTYGVFGRFG